jgi:hypothetical protein
MFISGDRSLTKENILKQVDSYTLFKTYCSHFEEIDKRFKSEFYSDHNPDCAIVVWKGDLIYKDFGEGESYRVFDYIAKKYNLTYRQSLQKVNNDFNLKLGHSVEIEHESDEILLPKKSGIDLKKHEKKGTVIEISPRKWTENDKKYWSSYKIPLRLLEYHNIKSISHYRLTNEKQDKAYYPVNPYQLAYSYDYYWHNGIFRRKLYFPNIKNGSRFISNVDNTIVQGWTLLPRNGGKILFITKSYKDILIFNLLGYWAIAPNNEGAFLPEKVIQKLKKRWDDIYVWYDNDETGIKKGMDFAKKFNFPFTCNPLGDSKDPSDFVKDHDLKRFDELVSNFLKNANNSK